MTTPSGTERDEIPVDAVVEAGVPGSLAILAVRPDGEDILRDLLADKARIDKLARYWNSQGDGHFLMGVWVENKNGSFRDAIEAL